MAMAVYRNGDPNGRNRRASDARSSRGARGPAPHDPAARDLPKRVRIAIIAAGGYAIAVGIVTLLGWFADLRALTDWFASGISMLPNTAVASALAGAALVLLALGRRSLAAATGGIAGLLGACTLLEHLTPIDLGIDTLLLVQEWGQGATVAPGRMGPPASAAFTVVGLALAAASFGRGARKAAAAAGLVTMGIALLSLIGYLYGASTLYSAPRLTAIAVPTSSVLLSLALGLVASAHDFGPMRLLGDRSSAGVFMRRLLPWALLLPILVGYMRMGGERIGIYDSAFGAALRTLIEVALLAALLWWAVAAVRAHELARRRSEEALRVSEANYGRLLGLMPVAVYSCDALGRITYFNGHAEQIWGRTPRLGDLDDRFCGSFKLVTPEGEVVRPEDCPMAVALADGASLRNVDVIIERPDGARVNVLVNIDPIRDAAGKIAGAINVFHDTTAIKQAEAALAAHQQVLEQRVEERTRALVQAHERLYLADRMAAVGTLAAGLAHDMKNVLMPLGLRLDAILGAPDLSEQARSDLVAVCGLLDHLRAMAGNLSLFARDPNQEGSEGRTELALWCGQVRGFIDASLGDTVKIDWQVADNLPPAVIAPHRLTQAVLNLVHNARDAVFAAGRTGASAGRITVSAEALSNPDGECVSLRVSDNGCGMSEDVRRRCLEPFFTTKDRRTGAGGAGGSGIGLSLAHAIVERIGGTMEIDSRLGEGTAVRLRLPVAPETVLEMPRPSPGRARVTIEDPRMRSIVVRLLRDMGYAFGEDDGRAVPDRETLWVTDGRGARPDAARAFLNGDSGRRLVLLSAPGDTDSGTPDAWVAAGAALCPTGALVSELRQAIAGARRREPAPGLSR